MSLDVVLEMMKPEIETWIDKRAPKVQQADELEALKDEFQRMRIDFNLQRVEAQSIYQPQHEMFDQPPKPDLEAIMKRLDKQDQLLQKHSDAIQGLEAKIEAVPHQKVVQSVKKQEDFSEEIQVLRNQINEVFSKKPDTDDQAILSNWSRLKILECADFEEVWTRIDGESINYQGCRL